MPRFKFREEVSGGSELAVFHVFATLADSFPGVGLGGEVEQPLVGGGVLHEGSGLSLNGQHHGTFAFLELLQEFARAAAERRQRPDVLRDVEPRRGSIQAPFWVLSEGAAGAAKRLAELGGTEPGLRPA